MSSFFILDDENIGLIDESETKENYWNSIRNSLKMFEIGSHELSDTVVLGLEIQRIGMTRIKVLSIMALLNEDNNFYIFKGTGYEKKGGELELENTSWNLLRTAGTIENFVDKYFIDIDDENIKTFMTSLFGTLIEDHYISAINWYPFIDQKRVYIFYSKQYSNNLLVASEINSKGFAYEIPINMIREGMNMRKIFQTNPVPYSLKNFKISYADIY